MRRKCQTNRFRSHRSLVVVLLFGMTGLGIAPTPALAVVQDIAPFDWSMPPRLLENTTITGHDPAWPIPQYDPQALMLPPGGWRVDFDACAVTTSTITSYEWSVDGVPVGTVSDCLFSHQFPVLARYRVTLRVVDDVGDAATLEQDVTVQDWLIVAVGDSYGSGEGNPERPVTAQVNVDLGIVLELVENVLADLQGALDQLPGLENAQQAAQQLRNDAQATRDQAAADLAQLQEDLQVLVIIETDVENEPGVILAHNNVATAQQVVNAAQGAVNSAQAAVTAAQADVNASCPGLVNCANALASLATAEAQLLAAETARIAAQVNLTTAEAALLAARSLAVAFHSAIATIQDYDALTAARSAAQLAVNAAQNTFNAAQNAFESAAAALQQAIDAVASLQGIIGSLQEAWEEARHEALTQYLDSLPAWTVVPPSWGTSEPSYREIVLNGAAPGEALRCHRSMISGQARAALLLEQADPRTSVTLVHLSCSGATINQGLIGRYGGQPVDSVLSALLAPAVAPAFPPIPDLPDMKEQIIAAVERIQGREVDALIVSIGGNDIKFSTIIEECILGEPCHTDLGSPPLAGFNEALRDAIEENCRPLALINHLTGLSLPTSSRFPFSDKCLSVYDAAQANVETGAAMRTFNNRMFGNEDEEITSLATKFHELNEYLSSNFDALDPRRVYITEYPDPTGDDSGNYCGWDPTQPPSGAGARYLPGVTLQENTWADMTVATTLRNQTETAAALHQWKFVSDLGVNGQTIASASRNHGYCADDHWMVTIPESLIIQQDHYGTVHPNSKGQALYAQAIYTQLISDLYPDGLDQAPRAPIVGSDSGSNGESGNGNGGGSGGIGWVPLILLAGFWLIRRAGGGNAKSQHRPLPGTC